MSDDIRLMWQGRERVIPAARAFELGAQIEEIVTLGEIVTWGNKIPFTKLARCYATMLRFSGLASVKDADVHAEIMAGLRRTGAAVMAGEAAEPAGASVDAAAAVSALMTCLMGGAPKGGGDDAEQGKSAAS